MRASIAIFLYCILLSASLFAQTPLEILKQAANSSGTQVVSSANIEFEAEVILPPPTAEQVNRGVARQEKAIQSEIDKRRDKPEIRKLYEKALAENTAVISKQVRALSHRKIIGSYSRLGPEFGGDQIYEVNVKQGDLDSYGVSILQRRQDEKTRRTIQFDVDSRVMVIHDGGATVGIIDPILIGRLVDPVLSIVLSIATSGGDFSGCSFDDGYQKENPGEVCVKFYVRGGDPESSDGKQSGSEQGLFARVVVDTTRGYVCPLIEFGSTEQTVSTRFKCSDYFQVEATDLWFPRTCTVESAGANGGKTTTYRFDPANVRLNESLSQELFSITIPAGTRLLYQLGQPQERNATCDVKVDIDGLDGLLNHRCLNGGLGQSSDSNGWRPYVLIGNLLLFAALALVYLLRRKNRQ